MDEGTELYAAPTFRGAASAFRWRDGGMYLPLVLCVVVGGGIFFAVMTFSGGHVPIAPLIAFCSLPVVGIMFYVLVFRRNKPPGYDRDLLRTLQSGRNFSPGRRSRLSHPFLG